VTNRQTDRQTDHAIPSVAIGHICDLIIIIVEIIIIVVIETILMTHIVSDVSVQWRIMVLGAGQTVRQTDRPRYSVGGRRHVPPLPHG